MKKIIAIVVTYNRIDDLKKCIQSLLKQSFSDFHIMIVDNGSNDGTEEYIRENINDDRVIYRNTKNNLGGAGGFNFGIKEAAKLKADYVWLMDDDCIAARDALEKLLIADKKLGGKYGFLASKVLWKNRSFCKLNVPRRSMYFKNRDFSSPIVPIVVSSFVSCFIPIGEIIENGLPIKDFFIWADDWEYTRRISRTKKCYLVNNSKVIHNLKCNIGSDISKDTLDRLYRYRYSFRNELFVFRREGIFGVIYYIMKCLFNIIKIIMNRNCHDKKEKIMIIVESVRTGINFHPKYEYITK